MEALEVMEVHPQDIEEGLDGRVRPRKQIKAQTPKNSERKIKKYKNKIECLHGYSVDGNQAT